MRPNYAPLMTDFDLFLYSYDKECLDKPIKDGKRKLARKFKLSYRYIDDLTSFKVVLHASYRADFVARVFKYLAQILFPGDLHDAAL